MKIEGWKEISYKEHWELPENERAMFVPMDDSHIHYFKKAQKFPIPFKINCNYDIDVLENGDMYFNRNGETVFIVLSQEIPFLVKAVEKAKEVMKKNETN